MSLFRKGFHKLGLEIFKDILFALGKWMAVFLKLFSVE